jgi:K+-sensing histidine kinase KdpD
MGDQKRLSACPFCGAGLRAGQSWCPECRLSTPTFRETALSSGGVAARSREWYVSDGAMVFLFVSCVLIIVIRLWVDGPRYSPILIGVIIVMMTAATMWGGVIAAALTLVAVVAADYFLVAPVHELGVTSWLGLVRIIETGLAAVPIAILCVRVSRWARFRR